MKKVFCRHNFIRVLIYILICIVGFSIGYHVSRANTMYMETGMYASDATWLKGLGELSDEDISEIDTMFNQLNDGSVSMQELHDFLEEKVSGKQEEFFRNTRALLDSINK